MSSPGLPSTCPHCGASLGSPSGDAPGGSVREARTPDPDETHAGLPAAPPPPAIPETSSGSEAATRPSVPPDYDEDTTGIGPALVAAEGARPVDDPDETRAGMPLPATDPDQTHAGMPLPAVDPDQTRIGPPRPPSRPGRPPAGLTRLRGTRGSTPPPDATAGGATAPTDTANDLVGQQLGFRYQILKLLGAGGMGAVYQAWDEVLNVVVALKTIRPEIAADPETVRMLERRFKQELLLARRVTHKNIVRVHDMGDVGGIKYITMPFLEGEELSAILKREGKLAVPRAMKLARSVVSGLVAAHEVGVVHRDLKPANIMVDAQGEGLIMDFGVARSTGDPSTLTRDRGDGLALAARELAGGQTQAGSVVGTVEYMAPEQARAQPVDQRADIYAFGLILYDVLLGRKRASHTKSAIEELTGRMAQPPVSSRADRPGDSGRARPDHHAVRAARRRRALPDDQGRPGRARGARRQRPAAPDGAPVHPGHDGGVAGAGGDAARTHVVAGARPRGAGRSRAGVGGHLRLHERDGRRHVRRHARAGAEAGARGGGVHQRVRSARHQAQPGRATAGRARRARGPRARGEAGRSAWCCLARCSARAAGTPCR